MTKQGTRVEVNTFVKGLITEASPLNFPPNASAAETNFVLKRDGTRARRLGMDLEENTFQFFATPLDGNFQERVTNTWVWNSVAGITGINWLVVQTGNEISFHDLANEIIGDVDGYKPLGSFTFGHTTKYSFTAVNGKLVIAGGGTHVAVVTVNDVVLGSYSIEYKPIRVRDVWGIEEDSGTQESDPALRNTVLTDIHEYNLLNQGWGIPRRNKLNVLVNPITQFATDLSVYPSNIDTVFCGLQFQPVESGADPYERMFTNLYVDRLGLDVGASKGYFVIDLHARGVSRREAVNQNAFKYGPMPLGKTYPEDYITSGPTCLATFAGRVFYGGFSGEVMDGDKRSPSLSNYIFFSKLVKSDTEITECHQHGDPTSREANEVVDTDGGFLRIAEADKIIGMKPLGKTLLVFATNGIWSILGGADYGFTATNYRVDKITSYGCVSMNSVVEVNEEILYWGKDSIYKIGATQVGDIKAEDFSSGLINTYYDNIPASGKASVSGTFDAIGKCIRWTYLVNPLFDFSDNSENPTMELVFDTLLGAFYTNTINRYYRTQAVSTFYTDEHGVKYLTLLLNVNNVNVKYAFAQYSDTEFRDWKYVDDIGADAPAYMLTGALTAGDSGIDKQSPYLQLHFNRTETVADDDGVPLNQSSCLMRCQWDWSNDPRSRKFSDTVETYRYRKALLANPGEAYDNGFDTVITKSKLRGRGKALTLYFETSPYKDCQLLGWNLTINGNAIT